MTATVMVFMDDAADGNTRHFEAVELVAVGIDGKRTLWLAWAEVAKDSLRFRGPDYNQMVERAVEQWQRIEAVRRDAGPGGLGRRPAGLRTDQLLQP